ncbi:hypothetical protein [Hymenobacter volaticus]|uniref:HIT-type domain-containing protein n=1 Tax=Hymenobacter volaticus TaxID=2932254 RepID=A0ABY4G2P1_9BACT|nr:hypothetical protein [Hymenobacter volaticus]UOQ64839.1 hypothetical protein MUN86_14840 [Hymenobacter volaticus]
MYTLEKECPICGTYFTGRSDKQFCSGRCRVAAHRQGILSDEELEEREEEQAGAHRQPGDESSWESNLSLRQPALQVREPQDTPSTTSADEKVDVNAMIRACLVRYDEQEAAAKAIRQQQADAALAHEMHAIYVKVVEPFLYHESQRLDSETLQELADSLMDARENYKAHPYLSQTGHVARLRLDDLWDALLIVQETQQEAKASWLSGRTGRYELKGKWRKQLRERLLE